MPESSLVFGRHRSVLSPRLPLPYTRLGVNTYPSQKAPRVSSRPFSISKILKPFFSSPCEDVFESWRFSQRRIVPRVWLPFLRPSLVSEPLEASFSSLRSWAFPFKALLLFRDRKSVSDLSLRSCTLFQNLLGFESVLQRLPPTKKAVSLGAPRGLV